MEIDAFVEAAGRIISGNDGGNDYEIECETRCPVRSLLCRGRNRPGAGRAVPTAGHPHDSPGVLKGGTRVQVIVDGLKHTDGPVAMRDGTLLYWDYMERRIGKVDPQG